MSIGLIAFRKTSSLKISGGKFELVIGLSGELDRKG